jgi:two-component system, OmpR family, sensor histidine kinase KdpD
VNAGSHSVSLSRKTVGQPADGVRLPEDPVRLAPSRRERILVGIRANERAIHLVRVGKRIADQCAADWTVVCVQTAGVGRANAEATELLSEAFRLAESLGAETVTLDGSSAAASLTHYACIRQVSRIVVGARRRRGLRRIVRRDVASLLVNSAASAQVIVVTDAEAAAARVDEYKVRRAGRLVPSDPRAVVWSRYVRALGITALCTAVAYPVYPHFDPVNIVMVYLLGTTVVGLRLGRGPSVVSAVGNVAAFDFFFVPPRYSFYFAETQYVFTFGVILGVALVIANLMVNVRRQTESAAATRPCTP